jgi:hypothetical protein
MYKNMTQESPLTGIDVSMYLGMLVCMYVCMCAQESCRTINTIYMCMYVYLYVCMRVYASVYICMSNCVNKAEIPPIMHTKTKN